MTLIDATDTDNGMGVYSPTGNDITYTAQIKLPEEWDADFTLIFISREMKQVSGDRIKPALKFNVGDVIDGQVHYEDGSRMGCFHKILAISPENELTLEPLHIKRANTVKTDPHDPMGFKSSGEEPLLDL